MRTFVVTAFLLWSVALSLAQPQLAPNSACPNNAPFCRAPLQLPDGRGVSVMGLHNGVLYGWSLAGQSCPDSNLPPDGSNANLCLYSSNTLGPENWTAIGQVPGLCIQKTPQFQFCESAIEIVFGSGSCSGFKYIYTDLHQIWRATSAPTDWNFTDVGSTNLPNLPPDTGGRPGSFAISTQASGTTTLYYGNYNDHTYGGSTPQFGAYIWSSTDCGKTWTSRFFGGREVHAINADTANPGNVYATLDDECSPDGKVCPATDPEGLWGTTNGGAFTQRNPNNSLVGIDFVFPSGSNQAFFETDGCAGQPAGSTNACTGLSPSSGPLLSWDKVNGGAFQIPAAWPAVPSGVPAWAGSGQAIGLTSEQNIFLMTNGFGFSSPRSGLWYLAPPSYNSPLLLEDLAPPISSVVSNGGTVTATTFGPHSIQPADAINICVPNQPSLNAVNVSQASTPPTLTVTGPNTFTYTPTGGPTCLSGSQAAFAAKQVFLFPNRTIEATDPTTHISYLYSNNWRMPKPQLFVPASGSALASFVDQNAVQHWSFQGINQNHVDQVSSTANGGFVSTDLTIAANAPMAAAGSPLNAYETPQFGQQHWLYFGADQHLDHIFFDGSSFNSEDLTAETSAPLADPHSMLASAVDSDGGQYWAYEGPDQHVYQTSWLPSVGFANPVDLIVSAGPGTPLAAPGSALNNYLTPQFGQQHWLYFGTDQHLDQILFDGSAFSSADLTFLSGAPLAASGSALATFVDSDGGQFWAYEGPDQHIYQAAWTPSAGFASPVDLTIAALAPIAATGSPLNTYLTTQPVGLQHWVYLGANQHVYQIQNNGNSGSAYTFEDITPTADTLANVGSPVTSIVDSSGGQHWGYFGTDQHLFQAFQATSTSNSSPTVKDLNLAPAP